MNEKARTAEELLAERVKEVRTAKGWTQADLAERLGMSRVTVTHIEQGHRRVTLDETLALAWVLEVAPVYLFTPWEPDDELLISLEIEEEHGGVVAASFDGRDAREWVRGQRPPGREMLDERFYYSQVPADEWDLDRANVQRSRGPATRQEG